MARGDLSTRLWLDAAGALEFRPQIQVRVKLVILKLFAGFVQSPRRAEWVAVRPPRRGGGEAVRVAPGVSCSFSLPAFS